MKRIFALSTLAFLIIAVHAFAQESVHTSTLTLGIGGGWIPQTPYGVSGGPVFNATYEYRVWKFFAVEAGVHNILTTTTQGTFSYIPGTCVQDLCTFNGSNIFSTSYSAPGRITSVPVGFRVIQPLRQGKVEIFEGVSGAYTWNAGAYNAGWSVEGRLGARFAVDKQRHFWLGTSSEYEHQFGLIRNSTVSWTADFAYRFGH